MRKFLGLITKLSEETDTIAVVEFLYVEKITLLLPNYGLTWYTIAVEVKDVDPKITWETVGIYRAPNEHICI